MVAHDGIGVGMRRGGGRALARVGGVIAIAVWAGWSGGCSGSTTNRQTDAGGPAAAPAKAEAPGTRGGTPGPAAAPSGLAMADIDHVAWGKVGYRLDWQGFPFYAGSRVPEVTRLVGLPDMVLAQERSSLVSLMEPTTGQVRWSAEVANPLTRFVGLTRDPIDATRVLAASESELFGLTTGTGSMVSRQKLERVVNTPPIIAGDVAIFGSTAGEVYAHNFARNVKAWGFMARGAINAAPVSVGGIVGVVSQVGDVVFLTPSGSLVGRGRVLGSVATDPVTDGSRLFVAALDQSLWAFDTSGVELWRYRTAGPLRVQPACVNGVVYCEVPGKGMTAFDGASGRLLWSNPKAAGTVIAGRADRVLAWDGERLALLDAARGDTIDGATPVGITRLVAGGPDNAELYAAFAGGSVARFLPR